MIRKVSLLILITFVCILLVQNLWSLDIAGTKNNALMRQRQTQIEEMQSIDSVKMEAKKAVQQIRNVEVNRSNISSIFFFLLTGILVTSIIIYSTPESKN